MFWISNVGIVLAPNPIENDNLEFVGVESGVYQYRVISRMGEGLQIMHSPNVLSSGKVKIDDPRSFSSHEPVKILDNGDIFEFEVSAGSPSIFLLSQKFHHDWTAQTYTDGTWKDAKTVEINDVFQGAMVPPLTERIRFEFRPLVRYAWIGHVIWLLLLAVVPLKILFYRLPRNRSV